MSSLNVEIKAVCRQPDAIRNYLRNRAAEFRGTDNQKDTYFRVSNGRLKLREGAIENNLIYYERTNEPGLKHSAFRLVPVPDAAGLKEALTQSIGILVVVEKEREIYYIDNVKFHIDEVPGLGSFMEIEAGNLLADKSAEELQQQCRYYMREMNITDADIIDVSYSDMLIGKKIV